MQKLLTVFMILALLIAAGVLFVSQRYEVVLTSKDNIIVFDRLTTSFIEKNAKGEWERKPLKKGEIFMGFSSEDSGKKPTGITTPQPEPQPKPKPDLKI
ncbi:MAG: hypothetical protein JW928_03485 [Candidatus Aureabacteria bacterium]|nr:hypothetical protein [Candidatus Auribacterota bacterium]